MDLFNEIDKKLENNKNVICCLDLIKNYNFNKYKNNNFKISNSLNKNYYKSVIYKNNIFELIIIKWEKNSKTSIHSHPENGCLLKPIFGSIKEIRYLNPNSNKDSQLKLDQVYYMHDNLGKHRIIADEISYSIHLYSPPNFYD